MKSLSTLLMLAALAATSALPQMSQPMMSDNTTKISDHVFAIMGFPNTAIVVGSHATLVVDTGLGPKNGATAARVAAKLAPNNSKLFLTTTHFHPEHAAGEPGFPPGTILIRDAVQQQEMEKHGQEMIDMFSQRSQQNKDLLASSVLRPPDVTFDQEATIDLGGVTARLLWFRRSPHERRRAHICRAGPHVDLGRRCAEQDHAERFRRRRHACELARCVGEGSRPLISSVPLSAVI